MAQANPDEKTNIRGNENVAVKKSIVSVLQRKETLDYADEFVSIFHAGELNPLALWDKQVRLGSIKRRIENGLGPGQRSFHVIELFANNSLATYITAPKVPFADLNIALPNLVVVCRSVGRSFTLETQIEDDKKVKRRFRFSNSTLHIPRRTAYLTMIPLRFQDGWNDLCIDLAHLTERVYGTRIVKVVRVQIFASVRLQQVFFVNDDIWKGSTPVPAMKMMDNVRMAPFTHLPLVNPSWREPGAQQRQIPAVPDPLESPRLSRVETELLARGTRKLEIHSIKHFQFTDKKDDQNQKRAQISGSTKSKTVPSRSIQDATSNVINSMIPEADEALKLLHVVKNMNLNPNNDPSVYVAALRQLRKDEQEKSRQRAKTKEQSSSTVTAQGQFPNNTGSTTNRHPRAVTAPPLKSSPPMFSTFASPQSDPEE